MKMNRETWEAQKAVLDRFFMWLTIGGLFLMLVSCSVLAPGMYILIMATLAAVAVIGGSVFVAGSMFGDPIGFLFAGDVIKAGFELAGAILQAAASASE
jgi:hypothetical protein